MKSFKQFISESSENMPKEVKGNLFWKLVKTKKQSNGTLYNYIAYFRGYEIHNYWFRDKEELMDSVENEDISISQYNKLKNEPEKPIK